MKQIICSLFVVGLVFGMTGCRGWWFWTPGDTVDNVGYHPKQPIDFSHKLHANEKQIPCEYCHSAARRSIAAGVPSTNTCMGCHKLVAVNKEPIKWLTAQYEANKPIEWVKVHDLPDFVRFTHKKHVAADLECEECHGQVKEMTTVSQQAPLQMGWCVECHDRKGASLECQTCHY